MSSSSRAVPVMLKLAGAEVWGQRSPDKPPEEPPLFVTGYSSPQSGSCVVHRTGSHSQPVEEAPPARINNGVKEAFSCQSTPSTPNTKLADSAPEDLHIQDISLPSATHTSFQRAVDEHLAFRGEGSGPGSLALLRGLQLCQATAASMRLQFQLLPCCPLVPSPGLAIPRAHPSATPPPLPEPPPQPHSLPSPIVHLRLLCSLLMFHQL
ncbi:unnamed protein product [Pleuronectes platessa]|uniref:Uncharacterized protein n=1 Tax=Pleuronectes platessa TaxID=8262 RepID=A0A9N7TWJ4_PLEPL|nr:unnamed protein product [Pleuronectes platessa]